MNGALVWDGGVNVGGMVDVNGVELELISSINLCMKLVNSSILE